MFVGGGEGMNSSSSIGMLYASSNASGVQSSLSSLLVLSLLGLLRYMDRSLSCLLLEGNWRYLDMSIFWEETSSGVMSSPMRS